MSSKQTIRAAVAQFHVGTDVHANLKTCLRMIDEAAQCEPDIIVLPEFCNHLSWYESQQQCKEMSVSLDGEFLSAIAGKAREHSCHVVCNVTLLRENGSVTGTSVLYSPEGALIADNTKQIYIGHENDYLTRASSPGPVVDTPLGKIGMYACMDGVINETPRALALNGAQILCNSINSFATDEGDLHIPVRAAENKVFVVAANKVGCLVPEAMVSVISEATGIPGNFLDGSGESQIVAPDGTVLAIASADKEEVIVADFDPREADKKLRPDNTDVFTSRRPKLYGDIVADPALQSVKFNGGRNDVTVACLPHEGATNDELGAKISALPDEVTFIVLPAMPGITNPADNPEQSIDASAALIKSISDALSIDQYAVTSLVLSHDGTLQHCAVLISDDGLLHTQPQVHASERYRWTALGNEFFNIEINGVRTALLTTDDSYYPETFRLLALQGVQLALLPMNPLEDWEMNIGLVERSAENRIAVAACAPTQGLITDLQTDFTILTQWNDREFDGLLSKPIVKRSAHNALIETIKPYNASHKVVSKNTDLLANRPWDLCGVIAAH